MEGGEIMFKFENGVEVKDKITGFKGVIVGRSDYISGCIQYVVKPKKLAKDGKMQDGVWFDEDRLIVTGTKVSLKEKPKKKSPPGGPAPEGHGRSL